VPALSLELTVEQGTSWSHGFIPRVNATPFLDETWSARAQARPAAASPQVLFEWSTELGNARIDPDTGAVVLLVAPAVSSAWTWKSAVYDLKVFSLDDSTVYRVAQGRIRVVPEVTR
jgi:hypothetical protein